MAVSRARSIGRKLLLIGALLATYMLFTWASMRVALRARETAVPRFTGLPLADATKAGDDAGLNVVADEGRRFDAKVPEGAVAGQEPPAGSTVRRGRTVKVWISAGSRETRVPRLIGEPQRQALARLQQDGLEVVAVADVRSASLPADVVVAQDPPPDARGSKVAVLINRGERAGGYVMPDLIGVPAESALTLIRTAGLRGTIGSYQPYPGIAPGVVLRQYPAAGFQVTAEDAISLEISR